MGVACLLLLHQALGSFPTDVCTQDKCTDICTHTNEWGYRQITDKERERGKRRVPLKAFLDICWEYGPTSSRILRHQRRYSKYSESQRIFWHVTMKATDLQVRHWAPAVRLYLCCIQMNKQKPREAKGSDHRHSSQVPISGLRSPHSLISQTRGIRGPFHIHLPHGE